jgi:hypothetical protein
MLLEHPSSPWKTYNYFILKNDKFPMLIKNPSNNTYARYAQLGDIFELDRVMVMTLKKTKINNCYN